jgi:hypothetical protein
VPLESVKRVKYTISPKAHLSSYGYTVNSISAAKRTITDDSNTAGDYYISQLIIVKCFVAD